MRHWCLYLSPLFLFLFPRRSSSPFLDSYRSYLSQKIHPKRACLFLGGTVGAVSALIASVLLTWFFHPSLPPLATLIQGIVIYVVDVAVIGVVAGGVVYRGL